MFQTVSGPTMAIPRIYLREWREARGLTQDQVAERIGMQLAAVSRYELGEREPNVTKIYKLAQALEIEPADLFRHPAAATIDSLLYGLTSEQRDHIRRTVKALAEGYRD